jgi:hypothetical protein
MGRKLISRALVLVALAGAGGPAGAGTCSSSTGCADCQSLRFGPVTCQFVIEDASCSCEISSFGGTPTCALDGDCTYAPDGGGTGGGSGGGGGGSTGCSRLPGEWCPSDCSSCTTVFF